MSTTFSRSMRAIRNDRFNRGLSTLVGVTVVLVAWSVWFFLAHLTVYVTSNDARVEVNRASYPLQAPINGRVVAASLVLGKEVQAGNLLVELDSEIERRQLEEAQARLIGLVAEIDAIRGEMTSRRRGQSDSRKTSEVSLQGARSRYEEAESAARYAEDQARRITSLKGSVSESEIQRINAEAVQRRAAASSLQTELSRIEHQQQSDVTDRQTDIEKLNRDIATLDGDRAATQITIDRLMQEIERRKIRAQVSGRLGEIATISVGSVLREGEKLGAIVPEGPLRVIAAFAPENALGRISAGQRAQLRLAGFPWTQYGSVPASVTSVANEIRDGRFRVELAIAKEHLPSIPLQHGLPGTVEVEVEQITPALLALRTAGGLLSSNAAAADTGKGRSERSSNGDAR